MPSLKIDDRDKSIQYSGSDWSSVSESGGPFMDTITSSIVEGATAQLKFQGTMVQVFGTINGKSFSSYSVDGSDPVNQHVDKSDAQDAPKFQQLLYESPTFLNGEHTLVVTNMRGQSDQPLILDFFVVQNPSTLQKTTSSPQSPISAAPQATSILDNAGPILTETIHDPIIPLTVNEPLTSVATNDVRVSVNHLSATALGVSLLNPATTVTVSLSLTPASSTTPLLTSQHHSSTRAPNPDISTTGGISGVNHHPAISTSAIAGIATGIALTFLIAALILWRYRRRQDTSPVVPYPFSSLSHSHEGNSVLDVRRESAVNDPKIRPRTSGARVDDEGSESIRTLPTYCTNLSSSVIGLPINPGAFHRRDRSQNSAERGGCGTSFENLPPYPGTRNTTRISLLSS